MFHFGVPPDARPTIWHACLANGHECFVRCINDCLTNLACTANSCQERQVKKGTYRTAHCCEGGDCGLVGPHRGDIYFRLSIGTFPLLGISGHNVNEVRLTTVSHEPGVRYVAVSHVWSDGLGNETSNRLPSCQLLRLRSFASHLRRVHIPWGQEAIDDSPLYLWIDTLCCPVADSSQEQKHYKQVAIGAMRQVYEEAAYVLVVDNTLLPFAYKEIGVLEAGLRLFTSPWMQRLWTLQEAVLAKNLVIQFKDRAVDLRTIWQDARSIRGNRIYQFVLARYGLRRSVPEYARSSIWMRITPVEAT